jgi:DNA-directed RNA polymerase subunit RPC12/RpoP
MNSRTKIALAVLALWALAVADLFVHKRSGLAILVIAVPFGLFIGAARAYGRNANKISKVGVQGQAGLACPKCGGTQFKAKRSAGGKVGLGLLAPKTRVRCVTCGAQYTRG